MEISEVDWDEANREKCQKHGVSIAEIEAVLRGSPQVAPDPAHSAHEDRFIAVGPSPGGRPIFVAFTFRARHGRLVIRPVTARYMHRQEAQSYEEASSQTEDGR
jgi:uncharacterized DUF497 family protein